jgi:hypothetical protein
LVFVTYASGIGAFVFHSAPGIRGGGGADRARGLHSNFWDLPTGDRIAQGFETLERLLPADLPNWTRQDSGEKSPTRPFDVSDLGGLSGLYCAVKDQEAFCAAAGIRRPLELIARRRMTVTAYHPVDGRSTPTKDMAMGERMGLKVDPAAVILQVRYQ